jgi:Pyruvate/2-oxoacid:ferredoxin oxidoreductase gamma subunit
VSGASFVARATTFDKDLTELMVQAIRNNGFSLIDIWEFCTAYFVPNNRFGRQQMIHTLETLNFPTGIIHREERPEYSRAYRAAVADRVDEPLKEGAPITPKYRHQVTSRLNCVVAGAAGQKVQSAARLFGRGAVLSGLWVSQRSEYPVAVKSGYSISEVILSPEEILFTGVSRPDLMVVLFPEGLSRVQPALDRLTAGGTLYISADLLPVKTPARTVVLDFQGAGAWSQKKPYWAIMALAKVLRLEELYPLDALREAIASQGEYAKQNLAAVSASEKIGVYS